MENQKRQRRHSLLLFICMLLFVFTNVLFSSATLFTLCAEKTSYTSVLEDLSVDSNFNENDYPENYLDNSIHLIQIAESTSKELFVYVYLPTPGLEVVSMNMATEKDVTNVKNYKLKLLSATKTLYKYVVENFTIQSSNTRYYNIVSIFRLFNRVLDEQPEDGNTITEVAYEVAQLYTFVGTGANTQISRVDTETITITDKYVGFVRYPQDMQLSSGVALSLGRTEPGFDSHFVAFNTDRKIDKLLEADVYYTSQTYSHYKETSGFVTVKDDEVFGNEIETTVHLTYNDVGDGTAGKFRTYVWYRIQTMEEFMTSVDTTDYLYQGALFNVVEQTKMTPTGKKELQGKDWVLRFAETDYKNTGSLTPLDIRRENWTIVGNVTILRLKFDSNGRIYNLGVVDGKHTSDGIPDNETTTKVETKIDQMKREGKWDDFLEVLKIIGYVLLGVIAFIILWPIIPYLLKAIIFVVKYTLLAVWWIITLPIRLIRRKNE